MTVMKEVIPKQIFMGKLSHDSDLFEEITKICFDNNIKLGKIEALGAVKKARLGFYNQDKHEYAFTEIDKAKFSITGLRGLLARHNIVI